MVTTTPIVPPSVVQPELDSYADRILGAAIEQFALHGIRRTSVDDVAAAARVGRVTVYRRFATKDELVRANRLTLLHNLLSEFSTIADFSEIVTGGSPSNPIANEAVRAGEQKS